MPKRPKSRVKTESERIRPAYHSLYDRKWRAAREIHLATNPICVSCHKQGRLVEANIVDHIIPHRGCNTLFWDRNNWQSLCKPCHDRKTWTEE